MKLKFIFLLLFGISSLVSFSNNDETRLQLFNSLKESKEDTNKVNTLFLICRYYFDTNIDSVNKYAYQALVLSEKLKYPIGIANSTYYIATYYSLSGNQLKALELYHKGLSYLSMPANAKMIAKITNGIASTYNNFGQLDSAFVYFGKTIKTRELIHDTSGIISSCTNLGIVYDTKGDYRNAITCFLRSLSLAESIGDSIHISSNYKAIARTYISLEMHPLALQYALKSVAICESQGNIIGAASSYITLADAYNMQSVQNFVEAEKAALKALELYYKSGVKAYIALANSTLARVYIGQKKFKEAEKYEIKAYLDSKEIGDKEEMICSLYNLGEIYIKSGKPSQAIDKLLESITIAESIHLPIRIQASFQSLSKAYSLIGDYRNAYNFYILSDQIKDSLLNEKNNRTIAELDAKYKAEEKDKKLGLQKASLNEKNAQIEKQNMTIYFSLVSIGFLIVIISLIVKLSQRNKLKKKIEFQNKLMELEQQALRSQMNPHFIFNVLNSIQDFMITNDAEKASLLLAKFGKLMRMILENSREKFIPLENEIELLEYYLELQQLCYDYKFSFKIEINSSIDTENIGIPSMLIQPFIENCIVHGIAHKENNGNIILRVEQLGEYLQVEIEDDGIGREKTLLQKKQLNSIHKSVGLLITQERVDIYNQERDDKINVNIIDLKDQNGNAKGTKGILQFPLHYLYN